MLDLTTSRRPWSTNLRSITVLPRTCLVLAVALALAHPANARADDDVALQVRDRVPAGEKPAIRVVAQKEIEEVVVTLKRDDDETLRLRASIPAGEARELTWKQETGTRSYKGEAAVHFASGKKSTLSLDFSVTVAGGITISVGRGGFSLEKRLVRFSGSGKLVRAEVEVKDEGGKSIGKVERTLTGTSASGLYETTWEAQPVAIGRVIITAYDAGGAWARVEVIPFSIFIPHEEVVFASGRFDIRKGERGKLDSTLRRIREAVAKNADVADLRLYIAGYTDTVSGKEYNRKLSARRARSIGAYFKKRGLRIPVYYQGFGEDVLAVETPDNTAEEKNRRALYLLSNHRPETSKQLPHSDWKRL